MLKVAITCIRSTRRANFCHSSYVNLVRVYSVSSVLHSPENKNEKPPQQIWEKLKEEWKEFNKELDIETEEELKESELREKEEKLKELDREKEEKLEELYREKEEKLRELYRDKEEILKEDWKEPEGPWKGLEGPWKELKGEWKKMKKSAKEDATKKVKESGKPPDKDFDKISKDMLLKSVGVDPLKYDIIYPNSENSFHFSAIGGQYEAKVELMEVVDFLKNPKKYIELGAKVPAGALLTGPPGNGKTLLAKAVAGESNVPFINTAGPQFIEKVGGLGAGRIRELFSKARSLAPCILFIDEIDAIGNRRNDVQGGMEMESSQTMNQLLVEMDGMSTKRGEVFVIGATNRDDILDRALLRSGRLDRKIYIDAPTLSEREEIFKINLVKIKSHLDPNHQAVRLALLTPGYSGADIANIVNEAAIDAARNQQESVEADNFEHAIERVIAGLERRSHSVDKDEMRISAYYEASQALLGWVLSNADKVVKMSVKPRIRDSQGFVQLEPQLGYLQSKEQILDKICQTLGGRAGEAVFFDKLTTRAENDLKNVTDIVYTMITVHGMGKSVPNLSFEANENAPCKPYSNYLQNEMDEEVRTVLSDAYRRSHKVVMTYKKELECLAEELIKRQVLNEKDIALILKNVPSARSFSKK